MRIAVFSDTYTPQMNGVAKTLARLTQALRERGHQVRVFTTTNPGARSSGDVRRFASVPFWAYRELRLSPPPFVAVAKNLSRWRPDLIHVATPFGIGLAGRSAARRLGVPLVTSYHTSLVEYARYYGLGLLSKPGLGYLRWFHNAGARTFVPTMAIARQLRAQGFSGLRIWSRGVDATRFHPGYRDSSVRERMGARHGALIVAYAGRVASEKGVEVAARAMREVQRHVPTAVLTIAGDGPALARCRELAPGNTFFAGRITGDALSAFYASADVFLFPSTTDTFGNVLMEAMASGLAVVAADVAQSREVVGEQAGSYARPGDPQAFADVILRLARSPAWLDRCRRESLARARAQTWESVFDALIGEYATVIRQPEVPDVASLHADPGLVGRVVVRADGERHAKGAASR